MIRAVPLIGVTLALTACADREQNRRGHSEPSPNASLLPAPLASAGDLSGGTPRASAEPSLAVSAADSAGRGSSPPPVPELPPIDRPLPEETFSSHDTSGYSLGAVLRWADPPPPAVPTDYPLAVREAFPKPEFEVTVDLSAAGRMRLSLDSETFPFPARTELRARASLYGHALVWPGAGAYRVLSPGTARALFAERRADVTPLLRAKVLPSGGGSLLGKKTIRTDVETTLGTVTLEQVTIPASSGELLCRLLIELVGADPTTEVCRPDRLPLAATYHFVPTGTLSFVVTSLVDRRDFPPSGLAVPPSGALFKPGELPPSASGVLARPGDIRKLRPRAKGGAPGTRAPSEGFVAENATESLLYVFVDGLLVAWVAPKSTLHVADLPGGRYPVAFRDFLGVTVQTPGPVDVPALVRVGAPEGDGGRAP